MLYDASNNRIETTTDTNGSDPGRQSSEIYFRNGSNVLLDFVDDDGPSGSNAPVAARRYLWGPAVDQLLAQENVESWASRKRPTAGGPDSLLSGCRGHKRRFRRSIEWARPRYDLVHGWRAELHGQSQGLPARPARTGFSCMYCSFSLVAPLFEAVRLGRKKPLRNSLYSHAASFNDA